MNRPEELILLLAGSSGRLIYQAADRGITVFVTTHYMDGSGILQPDIDYGGRPDQGTGYAGPAERTVWCGDNG